MKPTNDLPITPRRRSPAARSTLLSRQPWDTAKTTAPPAKNESPGDVFRGRLSGEVALFANAGIFLDWIVLSRTLAGSATVTSVTTTSLFVDLKTKFKPPAKIEGDVLRALEMLQLY